MYRKLYDKKYCKQKDAVILCENIGNLKKITLELLQPKYSANKH